MLTGLGAHIAYVAGAGKEIAEPKYNNTLTYTVSHISMSYCMYIKCVLVEGDGHDPVCGEESLLHPVAVMHVDVDIQHARVMLEEL